MKKNKLIEFDVSLANEYKNYCLIGIDEVGRGSLAGPVIACAFTWKKETNKINKKSDKKLLLEIDDSKKLTKEAREEIYKFLIRFGEFALGYASVLEIEKLNILNATFLAMKRAYENLLLNLSRENLKTFLLIDGNKFNPFINSKQVSIIDGDAKSALIASASIIAKVYRDLLMEKISKSETYNKFDWLTNSGYGTLSHRNAIKKHGITPLHRKLFVRKTLSSINQITVKD
ncbi:MAG: hypothetical protein A3B68_00530 [Candidatus Melainabacteria bacterium RIFCSPHIGHO2_02_FULL_34_12]|nr:MAG: hypothetical protein A3B68_00530 [Candidatus Melainabacteria bacterium RIFCSPHIGHO2_02_FULL_34_12]